MDYPIASRTLKKWSAEKLTPVPPDEMSGDADYPAGSLGFTFLYDGSTCNNGGTAYSALMHVVVSDSYDDRRILDARIEIPEEQKTAASQMCAAPGTGADEAAPFFERLSASAGFVGRSLEEVILEDVPENYAGCFCGRPHVNQKWKMVLSTIHFALEAEPD